jgi:hypothetical protein
MAKTEIQSLTRDQAFDPGAELWVLPKSNLAYLDRLNWLLNFQITEAGHHQPHALPTLVQDILNKCELRSLDFIESHPENLLIASREFVPSEWVLLVADSKKPWIFETFKSWMSLGKPRLRVFLPADVSIAQFQKEWSSQSSEAAADIPELVVS